MTKIKKRRSKQDAWDEGFTAHKNGEPATSNPYRQLTEAWFEWADGWKDRDDAQGEP